MKFEILPYKTSVDELKTLSGHDGIMIDKSMVYPTYEEARQAIVNSAMPKAVQFKEIVTEEIQPTATMNSLLDRIHRIEKKRDAYAEEHSIHKLVAKLVTCTKCDSRIAKDWIEGEYCPVCGNDLRSAYIPSKIKDYTRRIDEAKTEYDLMKERQLQRAFSAGKAEMRIAWLVPLAG